MKYYKKIVLLTILNINKSISLQQFEAIMIEHSKPTLGIAEKKALNKLINQNFIAEGPQTSHFEREISKYIGTPGCVATSTGTLGLHLALSALELNKNDEILIPSYTCRSVLNSILYSGLKPVLCDVDKETYNMSLETTKKAVTNKIRAIVVPHMFGNPAPIDKLKKLKILIIEDCAHSIGAKLNKQKVGSFGDCSIFSFEGTKYIVTGEGGMVSTNSKKLLKKLRSLKEPDSQEFPLKYTYRMTDLQAAVGRVQLKKLEGFIKKRRSIAKKYDKAFKDFPVLLPKNIENSQHIYQRYMIQIKGDIHSFMKKCLKKGIKVKQPVKPYALHKYLSLPAQNYPNTEHIMRSAISIPIYPSLTSSEVNYITTTISALLHNYAK